MGRVPLFPRRFPVRLQDAADRFHRRPQLRPLPDRDLPFPWHRVADCFPDHAAVQVGLPGHSLDRPDTVFVLAPDLLK
jgi:hypothetical protein